MPDQNHNLGPLAATEEDLRALLREVASLKHQADLSARKTHDEFARLLLDVIEVLDGFDRTLALIEPRLTEAEPRVRKWISSFRSVRRNLASQLESHEVIPIVAPDGCVIPGQHRVIETREQAGTGDGTILEEVVAGYLWRGEVLRQSEVVAVRN